LLLNVLPRSIADRLKAHEATIADRFEHVTVLFADIVGFTPLSSDLDPEVIVSMLNSVFSDFDDLAKRHGVQKIKTIGDAYMAAAGLPGSAAEHVDAVVAFALDMVEVTEAQEGLDGARLDMRIGVDTGPVVAGVIGHDRFIYDLWGDTVNTASRMEATGLPNRIHVTDAVRREVAHDYDFEAREPLDIKGKGLVETYILSRPSDQDSPGGPPGEVEPDL
jgi:class 3 adenylate cyclase